jgi:hypothetical protein
MPRPIASCGKGRWGASVLPAEWRARLMTVTPPARYACARIVWWEFFSMRLVPVRWPHIDKMIAHREEVEDKALIEALITVGAPRAWAEKRIIVARGHAGRWTGGGHDHRDYPRRPADGHCPAKRRHGPRRSSHVLHKEEGQGRAGRARSCSFGSLSRGNRWSFRS